MKRSLINYAAVGCMTALSSIHAQWDPLGPGAGGQIQGLYMSPNADGRAYFFMDVEGSYQTTDHNQTWFNMQKNNVIFYNAELAEKPGEKDALYMGTFFGIQISRDGGASWSLADEPFMRERNLGTVVVDPSNPERVFAAPEWRIRVQEFNVLNRPKQSGVGPLEIVYSLDSGETWQRSVYDSGEKWNPVYSISVDPSNSNVLWIAAYQGMYRGVLNGGSISWQRIAGPSASESEMTGGNISGKSQDGYTYGAAIAPGGYIYATWAIDRPDSLSIASGNRKNAERMPLSLPYVAKLSDLVNNPNAGDANWTPLMRPENKGMLYVPDVDSVWGDDYGQTSDQLGRIREDDHMNYWRPKVDPRSTSSVHKVLIGSMFTNGRDQGAGLFEGRFTYPSAQASSVAGEWVRIFAKAGAKNTRVFNPGSKLFDYDYGWQNLSSRARHFHYSPTNWNERLIWVGNDQNLYEIDTLNFDDIYSQDDAVDANYYHDWKPAMTTNVSEISGQKTWINRGITSTVDYDTATDGADYLVMVGADNMLYESYDAGESFIMSRATASGANAGLGHGNAVVVTDPVAEAGGKRFVIIAVQRNKFGGEAKTAPDELWIKRLDNTDPTDQWIPFAGGKDAVGGFKRKFDPSEPAYIAPDQAPSILDMCYDLNDPNRLFLIGQYGLYALDDINGIYNEAMTAYQSGLTRLSDMAQVIPDGYFRKIYDDGKENAHVDSVYKRVFMDADNQDRVYFGAKGFIKEAVRGDANWNTYTINGLYEGTKSFQTVNDFYYWNHNGDDYIVAGQPAAGDQTIRLSKNGGPFEIIANRDIVTAAGVNDEWLDILGAHFGNDTTVTLAASGLAGWENYIYVSCYSREFRRGIVLRGTIDPSDPANVSWEDWHSDSAYSYPDGDFLYQGWIRRGNVLQSGGQTYYYGNSQGGGTFRRLVDGSGVEGVFGAPTSVGVSLNGATAVRVNWSSVFDAVSYDVQQRLVGGAWQSLQTAYTGGRSLNVSGLNEGSSYEFRVRARSSDAVSGWTVSAAIEIPTADDDGGDPPSGVFGSPENVTASAASLTSATVSWNAVIDAVEYDIQKRLTGDSWRAATLKYTGGTTLVLESLESGAEYTFRVKARKASGQASGWTETETISLVPEVEPEPEGEFGNPANVVASSISSTAATLSWNSVAEAVEYDVQKRLTGDSWRAASLKYTGGTTLELTGLESGAEYQFRVKARKASGQASGWSESNLITLSGGGSDPDPDQPSDEGSGVFETPESIAVDGVSSTAVRLSWPVVTDAVSYDIHRQLDGDTWRAVSNRYTGGQSIDVTGLEAGSTYRFRVKARNAEGKATGWRESQSFTLSNVD